MSEDERLDVIEGTDAEGNRLMLSVERYFFYNGEEYVLLRALDEDSAPAKDDSLYVMRVALTRDAEGEEVEDFLPVEEELMESLIKTVSAKYIDHEEHDLLRQADDLT